MLSLLDIPVEVVLLIVEKLERARDISNVSRAHPALHVILDSSLLSFNIQRQKGSALFWAAENNRDDTAKRLLDHGADISSVGIQAHLMETAIKKQSFEVLQLLVNRGVDIEARREDGATPLAVAARYGANRYVRYLLEHGAWPYSQDKYGSTPFMIAAENGKTEKLRMMLERSSEGFELRDNYGMTAFLRALRGTRNEDVFMILLDLGADFSESATPGLPSISRAARHASMGVVRMLLDRGDDMESPDDTGQTVLFHAIDSDHPEMVRLLLEYGARTDVVNHEGRTLLRHAVERPAPCSPEILQMLKDHGTTGSER